MRRVLLSTGIILLVLLISVGALAQTTDPKPAPTPGPTIDPKAEGQERVRVFTEEVRLPVTAMDTYGHYDPTLVVDDVLVLEDGQPQTIRSVRHIPGNVLLILDTGGDATSLSGLSKKTSLTRDMAKDLISHLPKGDRIAILQSSSDVDLLQNWTDDMAKISRVLDTKLSAGKRSRIFEAMTRASQMLADQPEGSRHVVLITDGVESPGGKVKVNEAIKRLVEARATVHIISYTTFVRQKNPNQKSAPQVVQRPVSSDPIAANDPTLPPGVTRSPSFGVSIPFDPAMKKVRKAYEESTRDSEKWMTDLAEETGGRIFLPTSGDEMMARSTEIAGQIGAEYIVTYRPTRPLALATPGEYRKVEIGSRRVGLYLRSRRGYVVPVIP